MSLFFPLMAANLLAFYPDFFFFFPISPRNHPPFLWCKVDAFVSVHLSGKALSRVPSEDCAYYQWHNRVGGDYCNSSCEEEQTTSASALPARTDVEQSHTSHQLPSPASIQPSYSF